MNHVQKGYSIMEISMIFQVIILDILFYLYQALAGSNPAEFFQLQQFFITPLGFQQQISRMTP